MKFDLLKNVLLGLVNTSAEIDLTAVKFGDKCLIKIDTLSLQMPPKRQDQSGTDMGAALAPQRGADVLVASNDGTTQLSEAIQLFRITSREDGGLDLSPIALKGKKRDESGLEAPKGEFKGEIVKQIDAVDYYLGLLGIYVHQIFFVSQAKTFEAIPGKIWWLEQAAYLRMLNWEALAHRCQPDKPNPKKGR
jgi:hypothetical protein